MEGITRVTPFRTVMPVRAAAAPADAFVGSAPARAATPAVQPFEGLTGRVVHKGSPGWDAARTNFCTRIDYDAIEPKAVVFCQNTQDVVNAVQWARTHQVPVRIRSGRHSYEAYSVAKDALVIDVSEMNQIHVDERQGTASIGSGAMVMELYRRLADVGVTAPAATAGSVGMGGLTLGGGFGMTSRKFGLTCDQVVEFEVVNAQGEVLHANEKDNPDLYWALKGGGGGSYGVVTQFTYRTHPIPSHVRLGMAQWDWSDFDRVVGAWQKWAPDQPDKMAAFLRIGADRKLTLFAQYTPDPDNPQDLNQTALGAFQSFLNQVPPPQQPGTFPVPVPIPFMDAVYRFAGTTVQDPINPQHPQWLLDPHADRQPFKSMSALAGRNLPPEALDKLRVAMEQAPWNPHDGSQPSMVQLLPGGGVQARVPTGSAADSRREARFVLQYDAYWTDPKDAQKNVDWVVALRDAMRPYTDGAYANYHDATLQHPQAVYFGKALPRLVDVKQRYDPDDFFNFPQSIPTAMTADLRGVVDAQQARAVAPEQGLLYQRK